MHDITYGDGSRERIFDTLDELLNQAIEWASETTDYYFIKLPSIDHYDTRIYKVRKLDGLTSVIDYIAYAIDGQGANAKPIDPATIKRAS